MTTYNSYEAAKISNPDEDVWVDLNNNFGLRDVIAKTIYAMHKASPADNCMTVEKFLADGHKFVVGDIIYNTTPLNCVDVINSDAESFAFNEFDEHDGDKRFVLRAAALENQMNIDKVETQTPEAMQPRAKHFEVKKEVHLRDYQKSTQTEHQEEMSAFSSEVDWKNGDNLDWLTPDNKWCVSEHLFIGEHSNGSPVVEHKTTGNVFETYWAAIRKPETPQQREDRERLEAAYDLYRKIQIETKAPSCDAFESFKINKHAVSMWISIVDKTNYRKGVK